MSAQGNSLEGEIVRIQAMKPDEVRALWKQNFKKDLPKALTCDLLVRTLCWSLQEKGLGGHTPATLKVLAGYAKNGSGDAHGLRRLKPGTEIVREYQGQRHTVVITGQGFRWQDREYTSLTAIARLITGSNWNGPRFFGLREGLGRPPGMSNPTIGRRKGQDAEPGQAEDQ